MVQNLKECNEGKFMSYTNCKLCPRECGADRAQGKTGFCGCGDVALIAKTMLHKWEEPALAPKGKSGAIFFGGCTLKCSYCQNAAISCRPTGTPTDSAGLRNMMDDLISQGAENIDLVTPTQFLPTILEALKAPVSVPVIYNCGGYEKPETIELLRGKVDIFLPDLKYADNILAATLSAASNYFETATAAIKKMVQLTGAPQFQGDKLIKGTVIRHLILPGNVENSLKLLDWIGDTFTPGQVLVSLMRQYTPMPGMQPPFDRPITDQEYDAVLSWMYLNGLEGFTQEESSATTAYIPDF